jgi:hypothetical protein
MRTTARDEAAHVGPDGHTAGHLGAPGELGQPGDDLEDEPPHSTSQAGRGMTRMMMKKMKSMFTRTRG